MLNQITIVGRIASDLELNEAEDKKVTTITLAVSRSYKNAEGEYETDLVPVTLWAGIAENTVNYCKKGDIVGVRGRIETKEDKIVIVAEKLSFLSSGSSKGE